MRKLVLLLTGIIYSFALVVINNPNDTIRVYISKDSVNRVVLPSKILDVAYSKEKGATIKVVGNQAFIKIVPIKEEKFEKLSGNANPNAVKPVGEPKLIYKGKPFEAYFITQSKTYSFVFIPRSIRPQTIIINDFKQDTKKILRWETEDNYIDTLAKINKSILNGLSPFGYKVISVNRVVYKDKIFTTKLKNIYKGVLYKAYLFDVYNNSNKPYRLNPKFLYNLSPKIPKAITIFYNNKINYLLPYSKAQVVIITDGSK